MSSLRRRSTTGVAGCRPDKRSDRTAAVWTDRGLVRGGGAVLPAVSVAGESSPITNDRVEPVCQEAIGRRLHGERPFGSGVDSSSG